MTIVCGSDFSENAKGAARSAAAIARKLSTTLDLVHVVDPALAAPVELARAQNLAEDLAREVGSAYGVTVEVHIKTGNPDEALVDHASARAARLLVVASLGARKQGRWLLGSVAERVAQSAPIPVLVVRQGERLERWINGEAPLRIMVGADRSPRGKAALRWAAGLRAIGPCELLVTEIVWPPEHRREGGSSSQVPLDRLRPELKTSIEKQLEDWASDLISPADATFLIEPGWGRVDTHLTLIAQKKDVDLLVVGTHQRSGVARLWQGSVSRGVLYDANMNVACIPSASES